MTTEKERGLEALQHGDLPGAIAHLEQASREMPDDFSLLLYLGGAYHETKRDAEAVDALQRAVALQPENAHAHYNLGISLDRVRQSEDAIAALQRALDLQPDYPLAASVLKQWQEQHTAGNASTQATAFAASETVSIPAASVKRESAVYNSMPPADDTMALVAATDTPPFFHAEDDPQRAKLVPHRDPAPRGRGRPQSEQGKSIEGNFDPILCEEAQVALRLSIISLFGVGLIFGPAAIAKAIEARRWIKASQYLTGMREAVMALVLASVGISISLGGLAYYWWYFTH